MSIYHYTGYDIDEIHYKLVRGIFQHGNVYTISQGSYPKHKRLQYGYVTAEIMYPHTRPLAPRLPPIVSPVTSEEKINSYFLEYLMSTDVKQNETYTYGYYIVPQIEKIISRLKSGKYGSNQFCITVGGVESLDQDDPPCLKIIDIKIRGVIVTFSIYFRSWDLWAGLPENLGGLQLLKEYLCASVPGLVSGPMVISSAGMHMYDYQWPEAYKRLGSCLPENSVITEKEAELGEKWML